MLLGATATVIATPSDARISALPAHLTTRPFEQLSSADRAMIPTQSTDDAAVRLDRARLRKCAQRVVNVTYAAMADALTVLTLQITLGITNPFE